MKFLIEFTVTQINLSDFSNQLIIWEIVLIGDDFPKRAIDEREFLNAMKKIIVVILVFTRRSASPLRPESIIRGHPYPLGVIRLFGSARVARHCADLEKPRDGQQLPRSGKRPFETLFRIGA